MTEDMPDGLSEETKKSMGLYPKYDVIKRETGELVTEPVFVLNPQTDPLARNALVQYAALAERAGYIKLSEDIMEWLLVIRVREQEASLDKLGKIGEQE